VEGREEEGRRRTEDGEERSVEGKMEVGRRREGGGTSPTEGFLILRPYICGSEGEEGGGGMEGGGVD
jgi:hypothetical protein